MISLSAAALVAAPATALSGLAAPALALDGTPMEALRVAATLRGVPDAVAVDLAREIGTPDLRDAVAAYYAIAVGTPLSEDGLDEAMASLDGLSPSYREGVALMLAALTEARVLRDEAFQALSLSDIRFVYETTNRETASPGSVSTVDLSRAATLIASIDAAKMLHAGALVLAASERAAPLFPPAQAPPQRIDLPDGALSIGSAGNDVYATDVQLIIEPGGDDLYLNNAGGVLQRQVFDASGGCVFGGGTTGLSRPNLGCTPLPSSVCTYDTLNHLSSVKGLPVVGLPNHNDPNGPNGGQGNDGSCGSDTRRNLFLSDTENVANEPDSRGVAALLDLTGSDTYALPWTHDDALFGLVDFCYPGDATVVNTNRDLFQGGSLAGVSLLYDSGTGNDVYRGRLNAQGSGHVGGVAILAASGRGESTFWADRLSQGDGVAGAVGVLVNVKNGTSTYLMDPPIVYRNEFRPNGRDCAQEGRAGQAQGGFGGVGVLWNHHSGTSVYRSVVHETNVAYPFAPVLDAAGKPILTAGNDAQGTGESFPIVGTPGGLVIGAGLVFDVTDHADTFCDGAGMLRGSGPGTGHSVTTRGIVDMACGKFNVANELSTDDLGLAIQHVLAGAVGARVVD